MKMIKKAMALAAGLLLSCLGLSAQDLPVIKIDFNEPSRSSMDEVLEPGFTPWPVSKDCYEHSLTVEGVKFTVKSECNMRVGWNKAFVQTKEGNCRLLGDGLNFDPKTLEGALVLTITGLPAGNHTIQTYHNSWQDPASYTGWPIHVYVQGEEKAVIHRTYRQTVASEAAIAMCGFQVNSPQDTVELRFVTTLDDDQDDPDKTSYELTPILNGFELNTVSAVAQAKKPSPSDFDWHVPADEGSCVLSWSPAGENVDKHHLFFGTDLTGVTQADQSSSEYVGAKDYIDTTWTATGLTNLKTYYWRVDEEANGQITKGAVWSFRPRHLAFRGAEGYGRFASGGRGGKVVYVTNLNATGEGSFANAVKNGEGPRYVLFAVSGIIQLKDKVFFDDYLTVAGQTAPGKGVCITTHPFGSGDESVVRFLRSRHGAGETGDGMGMTGNDFSISDHCSISWSIDEGFSSRGANMMTLQRTMIAEALNVANHKNYEEGKAHGFAATISGEIGSYHHNLLAHCNGRNWSIGDAIDGQSQWVSQLDIFNNVVYNWGSRATDGEVHQINFVNNYYKMGPSSKTTTILKIDVLNFGWGTEQGYYSGNIIQKTDGTFVNDGTSNIIGRDYTIGDGVTTPLGYDVYVDEPFFPSFATIETARQAYKSVLSDVGCTLPVFDEHDQRIIRETLAGSYTYSGSYTGLAGLIDKEDDCGGYEDYGSETIDLDAFDTDRDGLPNWWEQLYGTNPEGAVDDFSETNSDPDGDGYTMLDDYLEWMATPHYYTSVGEPKTIDVSPYTAGFSKSPVYAVEAVYGQAQAAFEGAFLTINPSDAQEGIIYVDFKVTDSEGDSMIRRIGLLVERPTDISTILSESFMLEAGVEDGCLRWRSDCSLDHLTLCDLSGRVLRVFGKDSSPSCDIHYLAEGIYLLRAFNREGHSRTVKIVK